MKFSEKWLQDWVNPSIHNKPISTEALAEQLTMAGLEMESIASVAGAFDQVVVGQIRQAEQHPKADRLRVCQVDVGDATQLLTIVCGAPNARAGIKVAVAMIGAVLPNGMTIQRAKLRDVMSEGMLCSYQELGIAEISEGIIELPEDAPLGQDFRVYADLNDRVVELDITPNRGDCLSLLGIAREVATMNDCPMNEPEITPVVETISDTRIIYIQNAEDCGAYYGRVIKGIHLEAVAPRWLVNRVKRSGTRSISPVVDITNYVMYELGQPLHAFDLDTLQGNICVRLSKADEIIDLLDGQTVTLKPGTLVIADDVGPIAMAGIMGGVRTSVTAKTRNIFLESAWFSPTTIAGKARQYGISTDAAHRYERGVDPTLQQKALTRAANLIMAISGGDAGPEVFDTHVCAHKIVKTPMIISLQLQAIKRLLGITLTASDVEHIARCFEHLGLKILSQNTTSWEVQIPAHRSDMSIEADVVEEVARMYGYQRIPATQLTAVLKTTTQNISHVYADTLVARGYHEMISYSFVNAKKQVLVYPSGESFVLHNPISSEYNEMRKGLWVSLLTAASYNDNRQMKDICLFELGAGFVCDEGGLVKQTALLSGLRMGEYATLQWNEPTRAYDFYDIKGDVESLLALCHDKRTIRFEAAQHPALHPGQTARIVAISVDNQIPQETPIGWIGALHPELVKQWDLTGTVFLFELDLEHLSKTHVPEYQKLSKFPSIRRDLSFLIDASVSAQAVIDCILLQDTAILRHAQIFDQYQGASIAESQKSLAVALTLQHSEKTLLDTDVNPVIEKIIVALQTAFSIHLRE